MAAETLRERQTMPPRQPAPALGADTEAVLRECRFSGAKIAEFRAEGVV
jgi:crotonobetainyl-CoA:carnitine CoA-transferase CaiB-like acyl-CoA transferase